MSKKIFLEIVLCILLLIFIAGCGGGGSDDLGTGIILPDTSGNSNASTKLTEAKSLINDDTSNSYTNALDILNQLENNPSYTPSPNEKLEIRTGIKYCEIQLKRSAIESSTTSAYLEQIIQSVSGAETAVEIPDDTFFLLASSYFAQKRDNEALGIMKELGKINGVFNNSFDYNSEFNIAKDGDAHAFMALLFLLENDTSNSNVQKLLATDVSSIGAEYLAEFENLGL